MSTIFHRDGSVYITALGGDRRCIRVVLNDAQRFMQFATCETRYDLPLIKRILDVKGPEYLCDEILRDEDPYYIAHHLQTTLLSFSPRSFFTDKRLLDFGCGSGASTMILGRMFARTQIVGVDINQRFLDIAQERARLHALNRITFLQSPSGDTLPNKIGLFDVIVLSAVFEHLLPPERPTLIRLLWSHLKRGGILFFDETPHRFFPIESHTSGLPLINYFPDWLAHLCVRLFSKRDIRRDSWQELLRKGIRGGTEREIVELIRRAGGVPVCLPPTAPTIRNPIDLWYEGYARHATGRAGWIKQKMRIPLRLVYRLTGLSLVPYLSIAFRKKS